MDDGVLDGIRTYPLFILWKSFDYSITGNLGLQVLMVALVKSGRSYFHI